MNHHCERPSRAIDGTPTIIHEIPGFRPVYVFVVWLGARWTYGGADGALR
tara:strand:- start:792 stop:941 length:150 start_codon:yes stop_codon:yes gene_type:complete